MKQVHPDALPKATSYWKKQAEERARDINEAYAVLSDTQKRRLYDQQLDAYQQPQSTQTSTGSGTAQTHQGQTASASGRQSQSTQAHTGSSTTTQTPQGQTASASGQQSQSPPHTYTQPNRSQQWQMPSLSAILGTTFWLLFGVFCCIGTLADLWQETSFERAALSFISVGLTALALRSLIRLYFPSFGSRRQDYYYWGSGAICLFLFLAWGSSAANQNVRQPASVSARVSNLPDQTTAQKTPDSVNEGSGTAEIPLGATVGGPSLSVQVDGVSGGSDSNVFGTQSKTSPNTMTNVRLSDAKNTYQLTCNRENKTCVAPVVGAEYQLVAIPGEKPEDLGDHDGEYPHLGKAAFLQAANVRLGPYWMVAEMPLTRPSAMTKLIAECGAREQGLNENDCMKWLARRARMYEAACPDPNARIACRSFRDLLKATDPDLLDIFSRLENVYVCFHPQEDVFFVLWFGEPSEWSWSKADTNEQKIFGLQDGTLIQMTTPAVHYYDKGTQAEGQQIFEFGYWSYFPLAPDTSPSSLAHLATSIDAKFLGKTFQINGERVEVAENYENRKREEIKHTLLVQRSTGRFFESYQREPRRQTFLSYSGSCLVAPNAID
jgi:hypothetical protein